MPTRLTPTTTVIYKFTLKYTLKKKLGWLRCKGIRLPLELGRVKGRARARVRESQG